MSFSVFTAAWMALAASAPAQVVLPGVLDLPVTAGDKLGDGCKVGSNTIPRTADSDCVSLPGKAVNDAMHGYIKALKSRGWITTGGAAIQIWLERPRSEGGCERLDISAVADFALPQAEMMKKPGAVVFSHKAEATCRAKAQGS